MNCPARSPSGRQTPHSALLFSMGWEHKLSDQIVSEVDFALGSSAQANICDVPFTPGRHVS